MTGEITVKELFDAPMFKRYANCRVDFALLIAEYQSAENELMVKKLTRKKEVFEQCATEIAKSLAKNLGVMKGDKYETDALKRIKGRAHEHARYRCDIQMNALISSAYENINFYSKKVAQNAFM